jgi:hypothetical protein
MQEAALMLDVNLFERNNSRETSAVSAALRAIIRPDKIEVTPFRRLNGRNHAPQIGCG